MKETKVTVRLSRNEKEALEQNAIKSNLNLSDFLIISGMKKNSGLELKNDLSNMHRDLLKRIEGLKKDDEKSSLVQRIKLLEYELARTQYYLEDLSDLFRNVFDKNVPELRKNHTERKIKKFIADRLEGRGKINLEETRWR